MNNNQANWLHNEGLMPDTAFYELYDQRPVYEK